MTTSIAAAAEKIQRYVQESRAYEQEHARQATPVPVEEYEARLDATLRTLREQTERQAKELEELRRTRTLHLPTRSSTPTERLAQTRCAAAAYQVLNAEPPFLPPPDSVLPDLLALREASEVIAGLKTAIALGADELADQREQVEREEQDLRDARAINAGLRERLGLLRHERGNDDAGSPGTAPTDAQRGKRLRAQYRQRKAEYEQKTRELGAALDDFVDQTLAAMLAAEELGGPPVGDQLDIDDEVLEMGYTSRGKERQKKKSDTDARQRKIDTMIDKEGSQSSARVVARERFLHLLRRLLEASTTSSYITLDRDCAASRFLVKAKIAQYHPRDSRRLRLIDVTKRFE